MTKYPVAYEIFRLVSCAFKVFGLVAHLLLLNKIGVLSIHDPATPGPGLDILDMFGPQPTE
jgi:hypothetical protein